MKFEFDKKAIGQHFIAIVILALVALAYCLPEINGKILSQDDTINFKFLSKETVDFREAKGEEPLWTSKVFSGMPTFFITYLVHTNIVSYIDMGMRGLLSPTASKIFVLFIGFYILMIALGVNHWLALIGAIGYGLSSNLIVSILAGHNTKVLAIGYMAPAIAGALLTFKGKKFAGALILLIALSLMVNTGHYQIVYYFILISLIIGIVHLITAIKSNDSKDFIEKAGLLIITGIIAVGPNIGKVYNAYEHQAETIRGGKLKLKKESQATTETGLDKSYATRWSYGPIETMTVMIPSFKGGASNEALPSDGAVSKALNQYNLPKKQKEQLLKYGPLYTGEQPFILGTVYFGAVFIFLLILGLLVLKGPIRSIAISLIVLFLIISWGRHADVITGLFYDYLPGYNKFRTPSMAMAVLGIIVPMIGLLGLSKILTDDFSREKFSKNFKYAVYATSALLLMLLLYGMSSDWIGANDAQLQGRQPWSIEPLYEALLQDRKSSFFTDWFIALATVAISSAMIWLWKSKKIGGAVALIVVGIVIGVDMWRVSKRYLNADSFMENSQFESRLKPTIVDKEILADNNGHFRVLDLSLNPWTDGRTSYFHENIGGHHAAKLQRYQDLIEYELSPEIQKLNGLLRQSATGVSIAPNSATEIPALSMLNTKYLILQPNQAGGKALNPNACGNAWFVSNVDFKESNLEEMEALKSFDPNATAIINSSYSETLNPTQIGKSNGANIEMNAFAPNEISYTSNNAEDGLGVFSEVFYSNGWKAYVDGNETPIIRANYVLRALQIPAGKHDITMKFEPKSHAIGSSVSLLGSIIFVLFAVALFWFENKSKTIVD
jgi:hypothetical protein